MLTWRSVRSAMVSAILALVVFCWPTSAQQPMTLNVSAFANPWYNGGGGQNPPFISFTASPGQVLKFISVTGSRSCAFYVPSVGPEGETTGGCSGPDAITGVNGISGFSDAGGEALVGMFLENQEPPLNNPATGIGQIFRVGNGKDAMGKPITIPVPPTATRLILAFPDFCAGGLPGCYFDNAGSVTATFTIGCPVKVSVIASEAFMGAEYSPDDGSSLNDAASACGFAWFNWQQQITNAPIGSPIRPNFPSLNAANISPIDGSLVAPQAFYDPPPGGYTYQIPGSVRFLTMVCENSSLTFSRCG
jgi:hypothetical protein